MTPTRLRSRILVGPALRAQPDRRLVALAREGHDPAMEEIVRRYRPGLVRYAATIVPADRADDVVQDSMARALPGISTGAAELNLRPWLYTIVRNTALNNLRDAGPATDHLDENYDGVEQPPEALERREQLAALVAGVNQLPESQREALVKREMEGMSHAQIGAALGVSIGAARQLIHRGRIALREGLGVLLPLPVVRHLLEGSSAPAAAGAGAGSAVAAKAIVALLAAGGAVTAGVALDRHSRDSARADPIVALEDGSGPGAEDAGSGGPGTGSSGGRAQGGDASHREGNDGDSGPHGSLDSRTARSEGRSGGDHSPQDGRSGANGPGSGDSLEGGETEGGEHHGGHGHEDGFGQDGDSGGGESDHGGDLDGSGSGHGGEPEHGGGTGAGEGGSGTSGASGGEEQEPAAGGEGDGGSGEGSGGWGESDDLPSAEEPPRRGDDR